MTSVPVDRSAASARERVRVWDLPTRIFHWGLAGLLVLSWLTGEAEGAANLIHRLSGEAIAGLVVFRLAWGFIGGEHARFSDFLKPPEAVARHLAHLLRGRAEQTLGHNALGGWSVMLLLASVSAVVVTGLFSAGSDGPGGPLAGVFGWELSSLHEPAFRLLQAVVALHLLGVLATSVASRENLVATMITGAKRRPADVGAGPAPPASAGALLVAVALGGAVAGLLMSLPRPTVGTSHAMGRQEQAAEGTQEHDEQ